MLYHVGNPSRATKIAFLQLRLRCSYGHSFVFVPVQYLKVRIVHDIGLCCELNSNKAPPFFSCPRFQFTDC